MATLYWRGAVSNDVQLAANWSLTVADSTAPPLASPSTPAAGDTVIFHAFSSEFWNPIYHPVGLIGAGITHTVLFEAHVQNGFGLNVGTSSNFLKVYANKINIEKYTPNANSTASNVFIKSLNSTASVIVKSVWPISGNKPVYYIGGTAKELVFNYPTAGNNNGDIYLGTYGFTGAALELNSIGVTFQNGLFFPNASAVGFLRIGNRCSLGGDNVIRGKGLNTVVQRGTYVQNMTIEGAQSTTVFNQCTFNAAGITGGVTGPLAPKAKIDNFIIKGGLPQTNKTSNPYVSCLTGVSFGYLEIRDTGILNVNPISDYVHIFNGKYISNHNTTVDGYNHPSIRASSNSLVIGNAGESGGLNVLNAYNGRSPTIVIAPESTWDIV